jgi:hypothetical protein
MRWSEYEESGRVDIAVETHWSLTDDEKHHLGALAGDAALVKNTHVLVTKDYDNEVHWARSTGRRNTLIVEVLMGRPAGWMKELTGRAPSPSPAFRPRRRMP